MIRKAYTALCAVTDDIVISVRHESQRYDLEATYVADRYRGMGPLAGLDAGFTAAQHDWLCVLACDMPLVHPSDVRSILDAREDGIGGIVSVDSEGMRQPLCGCYYRPTVELHAKSLLQSRHLSMMGLLERIKVREVVVEGTSLINVNRPADLEFYSLL